MESILVLESGWRPGLIGRIIEMHARYFARSWNFQQGFEARLAQDLGTFFESFNPQRDFVLAALEDDRISGSIVIDSGDVRGTENQAELRWFIVDSPGRGVGRRMLAAAMDHVDRAGFASCRLSTFQDPEEARRLYEEFDFRLVGEHQTDFCGAERPCREYLRTPS
ncbi:GNAT family N-acetyltransferase [Breoghania sp. L-A4]|nr:GNAT family N-acetyltransferase [Breoghania sp. L-A4]